MGTLYAKILGSDIIIWFVSNKGNDNVPSLEGSGGTSYGNIYGDEFVRWIVSKIGTDYGTWIGYRVGWTVCNTERYILISFFGCTVWMING